MFTSCPLRADGLRLRLSSALGIAPDDVSTGLPPSVESDPSSLVVACTGARLAHARAALDLRAATLLVVDEPGVDTLARALDAGANAVLSASEASGLLAVALRSLRDGSKFWISPEFGAVALARHAAPDRLALSGREREIWALLITGKSNEQISDSLYISIGTVKNTVTRIYRKLGVRNRSEALLAALGHQVTTEW